MKRDDPAMLGGVTGGAKPLNIQRSGIVRMMGLRLRSRAVRARLAFDPPGDYRSVDGVPRFDLVEMAASVGAMLLRIVADPFLRALHDLLSIRDVMETALISDLRLVRRIVPTASGDVFLADFFGGLHGEEILA